MEDQEMLSLYDYLGKAAGSDLGKMVFRISQTRKVKVQVKEVSNPAYQGKVLMYPKWFLDEYFNKQLKDDELPLKHDELPSKDDELPF